MAPRYDSYNPPITASNVDSPAPSTPVIATFSPGKAEKVIPLGIPPRSTSVTGHYVMYLEDLDVSPGDFVSYYVRARDLARGKRASESRSDIFFLEVRPFEEEFTLAQTQASQGGGSGIQISDRATLQSVMNNYRRLSAERRTEPPVFVPTGVFIESASFNAASRLSICRR